MVIGESAQRHSISTAATLEPAATSTGRYWFHQQTERPAPAVDDVDFQTALLNQLDALTGVDLPEA